MGNSHVLYYIRKTRSYIDLFWCYVAGIAAADFEVINASGTDQSWIFDTPSTTATAGTAITIRATVPANTNGTFRLRLKATSVMSGGSSSNNAPASATASTGTAIDIRPQLTVSSFAAPSSTALAPITASTSTFVLTIDRAVPKTELTTSDFSASIAGASISSVTGRGGATTASIYDVVANNPTTSSSSYTLTLAADSISASTTYKAGPTSDFTSSTVYYDTRSAITVSSFVAPTSTALAPITASTSTFVLTLGTAIPKTELVTGDFSASITGASISSVTGRGGATTATIFDVVANNPSSGTGSYTISLSANSISSSTTYLSSPASATTSAAVYYAQPAVIPTIATASWATPTYCTTSGKLQANLTFAGANVTGIAAADFSVLTSSNGSTTGWSASSPSTATAGTAILIEATPPANTNGSFKIRLTANSVRSDGSSSDNAPAANTDSVTASVDNRNPQITVSSFAAPTSSSSSPIRTGTSTFVLT